MPNSHRLFTKKEINESNVAAAKEATKPMLDFVAQCEKEFLNLLDSNDVMDKFYQYIYASNDNEIDALYQKLLESFDILNANVRAYSEVGLWLEERYPTPYIIASKTKKDNKEAKSITATEDPKDGKTALSKDKDKKQNSNTVEGKAPTTRLFTYLSKLSEEIQKEAPSAASAHQHYQSLKLEYVRLANFIKQEKLSWGLKEFSSKTTDEKKKDRSRCTII